MKVRHIPDVTASLILNTVLVTQNAFPGSSPQLVASLVPLTMLTRSLEVNIICPILRGDRVYHSTVLARGIKVRIILRKARLCS